MAGQAGKLLSHGCLVCYSILTDLELRVIFAVVMQINFEPMTSANGTTYRPLTDHILTTESPSVECLCCYICNALVGVFRQSLGYGLC